MATFSRNPIEVLVATGGTGSDLFGMDMFGAAQLGGAKTTAGVALDTVARVFTGGRSDTETTNSQPADLSVARLVVGARTQTETTPTRPTADSTVRGFAGARTDIEIHTASDAISRASTTVRVDSETATTNDVFARVAHFNREPNDDTLEPTDAAVSRAGSAFLRLDIESAVTADGIARAVQFSRFPIEYPPGITPDWPLTEPVKHISGVVYDEDTAGIIPGATVLLFRQADGVSVQGTTSGIDGSYSFARGADDPYIYFVVAYKSTTPEIHGVTDRGLVPV